MMTLAISIKFPATIITKLVIILSKQTLTQARKDVLKKGLSFIPKPKKPTT